MKDRTHILIISYLFPPAPGVGGRRWAKFSKYLVKNGYFIHVITASHTGKEKSGWLKDVQSEHIKIYSLPPRYPSILWEKIPKTIFQKFSYKFWEWIFKRYSKGVAYDRSIFWKNIMLKTARKIIVENGIKNVFVTAPPFRLLHHALNLKNEFPEINLISDFRDPWTDNKSYHGFKNIDANRLNYEEKLENEVLSKSDYVLAVSEKMLSDLRARTNRNTKFLIIPNGFDDEDINKIDKNPNKKTDGIIRFVYSGSLYPNLEYVLHPFKLYLQNLKIQRPDIFSKIVFNFYGKSAMESKLILENIDCVNFHEPVSQEEILGKINDADAGILFYAPDHSFALNTKFLEYLAMRKPIILFANQGETSKYLLSNELGYYVNPENVADCFNKILHDFMHNKIVFNSEFSLSKYSLASITDELIKIIK